MEGNETIDFGKIASEDFEKVKNAKITWVEVAEKLKQPVYYSHYVKLLEEEAERMRLNKEVYVSMSLSSFEQSIQQIKSTISPSELIEIYNDIDKRNPQFGINIPDSIYHDYYKEIARQDFEKISNSKITWLEVGEKLNNIYYKENYIKLLEEEAERMGLNKEVHVSMSLGSFEQSIQQIKSTISPSELTEIYNDIILRNPQFEIKMPDMGEVAKVQQVTKEPEVDEVVKESELSRKDKINIKLESIEKHNPIYVEAKEDLEKHLNNEIADIEIAEKLNSNLEYKIAFIRYLEKDFYDKDRIGIDAKSYIEERINSINLSLLHKGKKLNDQEGFYAEEKVDKISDNWIKQHQQKLKDKDESDPILDILNKLKALPNSNGDVVYSLNGNDAFIDKGQSIQFSSNQPSDDEIIAGVLLAKEKYHDLFALVGPKDYQKRVMQIMIDNKIEANFFNKKQAEMFAEMKALSNSLNSKVGFTGKVSSEQAQPEQAQPEQAQPGQPQPEQPQPEQPQPGQAQPGQAQLGQAQLGQYEQEQYEQSTEYLECEQAYAKYLEGEQPEQAQPRQYEQEQREQSTEYLECEQAYAKYLEGENKQNFSDSYVSSEKEKYSLSNIGDLNMAQNNAYNQKPIYQQPNANNTYQPIVNQNSNSDQQGNKEKKVLALKGIVAGNNGDYIQNVLLWTSQNDKSLSGKIITPDGLTHLVKADIVPRENGKPNFLAIKVQVEQGDGKAPYIDWGYANAVNSRKDNKAVYYDEVVFNLQKLKQYGGLILRARVGDKVSDELHKALGFVEPRQPRPENKSSDKAENKSSVDDANSPVVNDEKRTRRTRKA